jgi:hypothetical protein
VRVVKKKKKRPGERERESRKKKKKNTPRTNSIPKLEANIWLDKKE